MVVAPSQTIPSTEIPIFFKSDIAFKTNCAIVTPIKVKFYN